MSELLRQSLPVAELARLLAPLERVDARLAASYPGGQPVQPAHTCYIAAHLLRPREPQLWGEAALALLAEHAPDAASLSFALSRRISGQSYADVRRILQSTPVQDLRVDFEDGYGRHADDVEDAAVDTAVAALAVAAPPSFGLRVKAFEAPTAQRGARTVDRWLTGLRAAGLSSGTLTLPKVQAPEQVAVAVSVVEAEEAALGMNRMRIELQIETAAAGRGERPHAARRRRPGHLRQRRLVEPHPRRESRRGARGVA